VLVDEVNRSFNAPAVDTATGGARGGGAALTRFGASLVKRYRALEHTAQMAAAADIKALVRRLAR
jgi:molybdate transport system regulatory protein